MTLVPYFVSYQIEQTRIPSNDDYAELTAFTDDYLNKYFQVIFRETPEAVYVSSATALAGSQFRLGEPVQVDYNTTLSFAAISMQIPDGKELDMLLASAFEGANGIVYTSALAVGLDPSNIFVTTSAVTFNSVPQIAPQSDSGRRVGIAAGSAALAFVTMISGLALYFRRHEYEQVGSTKNLMGHMTVDGDTYTGDEKTLDSLPHVPTKYRFDGGSSQAPSTVEWGEYPEDVVANTSNFRVQSTEYESEGEEGSDETEDDEKKEETVPEVRQQRLDDVSL